MPGEIACERSEQSAGKTKEVATSFKSVYPYFLLFIEVISLAFPGLVL